MAARIASSNVEDYDIGVEDAIILAATMPPYATAASYQIILDRYDIHPGAIQLIQDRRDDLSNGSYTFTWRDKWLVASTECNQFRIEVTDMVWREARTHRLLQSSRFR
jgi:hypothetical protein